MMFENYSDWSKEMVSIRCTFGIAPLKVHVHVRVMIDKTKYMKYRSIASTNFV
jgi:hypothetical protein